MKIGLLLLCVSSFVYARQSEESFVTEFANSLNAQFYGQRPAPQPQPSYIQLPQPVVPVQSHYDALSNTGELGQLFFPTYGTCRRYIANVSFYVDCVFIAQ